ncbi:hypothetical protein CEXT_440151 [Caerostris extrusa]|uniref:Uncharacterized protein n=1 Tax=Caerostris extrusa TaxID=172846 RepID=A0AAV4XMV5_CAEEX|nr:hypothetical protein CEXT_440151 [Caerostris extrusa]
MKYALFSRRRRRKESEEMEFFHFPTSLRFRKYFPRLLPCTAETMGKRFGRVKHHKAKNRLFQNFPLRQLIFKRSNKKIGLLIFF